MNSDDRVLIAYVPSPRDFDLVRREHWYRIPQRYAPKGIFAEYLAFYFGQPFGPQKWAIHYYAPNLGHELVRRIDLLPAELSHPRAQEIYVKIQLGEVVQLDRPIVSLRWRRILFLHTTGDRFRKAIEVKDLVLKGSDLVNRESVALHDLGGVVYLDDSRPETDSDTGSRGMTGGRG